MAGVSTEQGSNKLNVELNLVPFIDLLSSLVLFLLITAVWLQISAIPASVSSRGKSTVSAVDQSRIVVHLGPSGYTISWPASWASRGLPQGISKSAGGYDLGRLKQVLTAAGKALPQAAVSADDSVTYGAVVETVDVIKSTGAASVAMSTE